jgi:hypothetical protein
MNHAASFTVKGKSCKFIDMPNKAPRHEDAWGVDA